MAGISNSPTSGSTSGTNPFRIMTQDGGSEGGGYSFGDWEAAGSFFVVKDRNGNIIESMTASQFNSGSY